MLIIIEPKDVNVLVDFTNNMITLEFEKPLEISEGDTVIINEKLIGSMNLEEAK